MFEDRGDEDGRAEEELPVCGGEGRVVGEFPCQRAENGGSRGVSVVEERVDVGEEAVADVHGHLTRFDDGRPDVRLLANRSEFVVVAVKWEECRELHPPITQLLISIPIKPARIHAEHRDPEQLEVESLRDAEEHVQPLRVVVAAPMAGPFPSTGECGAADDEGPFGRKHF